MKKLCLLFSLCPVFLWGQVKIDFENGLPDGLEQFPAGRWGVSASDPLEGKYSFQHVYDNENGATDIFSFHIKEPRLDSQIQWSFIIDYDYRPSGSNNWCFYLLSEKNAEGMKDEDNRAIMMGVNQTKTDDSLRIYYMDGGHIIELVTCSFNCENDMNDETWQFLITMDPEEGLKVSGCPYPDKMKFLGEKRDFSFPFFYPSYTGLSYSYTSSKDMLLSVDLIELVFTEFVDSDPPEIVNVRAAGAKLLEIRFNEEVFENKIDSLSIDLNYEVERFWLEDSALFIEMEAFPVNDYKVEYQIRGIYDRRDNSGTYSGEIIWYYPKRHDIIFTEIMADPSPPVYLPENEYVEIYNRSSHKIDLKGWKFFTGDRSWLLPEIELSPGNFYFFTSEENSFPSTEYKNYSEIFSSGSVINNKRESVVLFTPDDVLIDAVPYSRSWYNDDYKAEGGWSLERMDTENLCGWQNNWKASESFEGGTPGMENSIKQVVRDFDPPFIKHIIRENDSTFIIRFNESLDEIFFDTQKNAVIADNLSLSSMKLLEPFYHECRLGLSGKTDQVVFVFRKLWADCEGNISLKEDTIFLHAPAKPKSMDVIISEVLFSAWPGCPEFIELYNNSNNIISVSDIQIDVSKPSEPPTGGKILTEEEILFFPHSFLVLTKDPEKLGYYYQVPDEYNFIAWQGIPSLPDKEGKISVYDRANVLIDKMVYRTSDHFPLITDLHGVSLERIFLDRNFGTSSEWHSASSLRGFATPGSLNSQNINARKKESCFSCEYETFTPDNDGYRDVAVLNIKMEKEGYLAMIRVFDSSGRLKRTIGNSELLGTEESITWDGRDEGGNLCPSGIYLMHMEAIHLSGSKKVFKEAVVLSR